MPSVLIKAATAPKEGPPGAHKEACSPVILSETLPFVLFSFVFVWQAQKDAVLLSAEKSLSRFKKLSLWEKNIV